VGTVSSEGEQGAGRGLPFPQTSPLGARTRRSDRQQAALDNVAPFPTRVHVPLLQDNEANGWSQLGGSDDEVLALRCVCWLLLPPLKGDGRCSPGCKEQGKEAESDVVVVVVWLGVGRESKQEEGGVKTSERKQQLDREDFPRSSGNQCPCLGASTHVALPSWPSDSPRFVCHTLYMSSYSSSCPPTHSEGFRRPPPHDLPIIIGSTSTTSNMVSGEARPVAGYRGSHMERECLYNVPFVPVPGALMLCVVCLSLPFQTSHAAPSLLSLHLAVRAPTPRPEDAVQTSIEHL